MEVAKASVKELRQSPRKVRLVADMVRGKKVEEALTILSHVPKKATRPIKKLIESAVANAKQKEGTDAANLSISKIAVDAGQVLRRREFRARGSANILKLRNSHISLVLSETVAKPEKKKASKKKTATKAEGKESKE